MSASVRQNRTITAASVTKTYGNKAFTLKAKATGDGKLTYKSSKPSVASITANGKVTIKGVGVTKITITAPQTATYQKAEKTIKLTVLPKSTALKSLKKIQSGKLSVTWKQVTSATGYKVQIATNKNFKKAKTYKIKTNKTTNKIYSVKKGKTYYVRVCTYKGNLTTPWSKPKKIKS